MNRISFFLLFPFLVACFKPGMPGPAAGGWGENSRAAALELEFLEPGQSRPRPDSGIAAPDPIYLELSAPGDTLRDTLFSMTARDYRLASMRPWCAKAFKVSGGRVTHAGMAGPVFITLPGLGRPPIFKVRLSPLATPVDWTGPRAFGQ